MSWARLKAGLDELTPSGSHGFEGFVAAMLQVLLDRPFLVARAGDQPGGDGRSYDGAIRVQAKHYTAASVPGGDIIADFHRIRHGNPEMETYVIVSVSVIPEQLRSALDVLEIQFGIDILTLSY